ncbi:glycoside hydrolase family 76 protein [Deinococcus koreensis]|uniref:Glycosyl hydrolase n=1 Tax=Deinococcus koreensis TaxID=2054903 RepID=A0A2K3UYP2_9DEIO|nr:glycoside hydrolase family 76 protein [Deinococcus koreensis]PNY81667.1 glycosyl hydrolase [Deinococcus koreensis]
MSWRVQAAQAQAALDRTFWDEAAGLYRTHEGRPAGDPLHYWWQAHALDALLDAHARGGDTHLRRARTLVAGVRRAQGGTLHNEFYDDMLWMALALERLHAATGEGVWLDGCRALWTDIRQGWNPAQGGGVAWRRTQPEYKNTPANAPAALLGARLFRRHGDPADLAFARRVWDWLLDTLVDPHSGVVWDGVNRRGDGATDLDWAYTYNEGTVIGAGTELWRATGETPFLEQARRTARAAAGRYGPVFPAEGPGDGGLFKGILARYLSLLARHDPALAPEVRALLEAGAGAALRHLSPGGLSGPDWGAAPAGALELGAALSGVTLLGSLAALEAGSPAGTLRPGAPAEHTGS